MTVSSILIYFIISFLVSVILGPIIISRIAKLNIGQNVRDDGPESHLSKSGTPTMGGIIMVIALLITLLLSRQINKNILILLFSAFSFGLIGFIDDYFKIANKRSLGLKPYQKLIGQFIFAIVLLVYHLKTSGFGTEIILPFTKNTLDLGILYIPLLSIVVVGTVNSVNLTDGLDGLASSITFFVMTFFSIAAFKLAKPDISLFAAIIGGACLGFLIYNAYPAKIFMGDTGSMFLGGAVAGVAILLNLPIFIAISGLIYFIEALSVMIQVISYKTRKKRVFLMAPIHHHFEEKGWHEVRVIVVFTSITIILSLVAYMGLF